MKIRIGDLKRIIQEEMDSFKELHVSGHEESEEEPEEETEEDQADDIVEQLRGLLDNWPEKEHQYYLDIKAVVEQAEQADHPGKECDVAHPDQSHEEWMGEKDDGEETAKVEQLEEDSADTSIEDLIFDEISKLLK